MKVEDVSPEESSSAVVCRSEKWNLLEVTERQETERKRKERLKKRKREGYGYWIMDMSISSDSPPVCLRKKR